MKCEEKSKYLMKWPEKSSKFIPMDPCYKLLKSQISKNLNSLTHNTMSNPMPRNF